MLKKKQQNPNSDSRLVKAEKEISKILRKYKIGATIALVSDSHAQFNIEFPDWSLIKFEGECLRMEAKKDDPELTNRSAHLLLALRDMLAMQFAGIDQAAKQFTEAIESSGGTIDYEPFAGMSE